MAKDESGVPASPAEAACPERTGGLGPAFKILMHHARMSRSWKRRSVGATRREPAGPIFSAVPSASCTRINAVDSGEPTDATCSG